MEAMISNVIMIGIIIAVSFLVTKIGWIGENVREGLSRLIIKLTAPLMIFTSIASLEYDKTLVVESATITIMSFIIVFLLVLIGKAYARAAGLDEKTRGVQVVLMSFGNVAFLAYPLFEAVFGTIGVFYGAFYHLANDISFWTISVSNIDYNNKQTKKERFLKIFNQNMVAIVLGIVAFLTRLRIPGIIFEPLAGLGRTTVYLTLVFIGATMAGVDVRKTYKKLSIYAIIIVKMLAVPIIMAFVLIKIYSFGLSQIAISAVVLQISMPVMTMVAITANELGGNSKYASEAVFVTTAVSLVTMPIVLQVVQLLSQ